MTKQEFLFHLDGASIVALKFAERYVKDKLVTDFKYNILLTDAPANSNLDQFDTYPEEDGIIKLGLTNNEVVDLLYRKNKIPIWIDINVLESTKEFTTFQLASSGKYSDDKNQYYYTENGSAPFGIKSPTFPIGYVEGEKFWLKKNNTILDLISKMKI
jgi:hypothetical protein